MKLTKKTENAQSITFTYDRPAGTEGYRYYAGGSLVSRTFDPADLEVTFGKVPSGEYAVEAIGFTSVARAEWPEDEPVPPDARLVAEAKYDGYTDVKDVPLWKAHGEQAKTSDRLTIVTDADRGKVMRCEIRSGDNNVAGSGNGERSEVMCSTSVTAVPIIAVANAIKLSDQFASNGSDWNTIYQWHHTGSTGQSNILVSVVNSKDLRVRVMGANGFRRDIQIGTLAKNRWYEIVVGEVVSTDPAKGRIVVLLDGVEKTDQKVSNQYSGQGRYWKQGIYRTAQSNTSVMFFGPTRFWTADTLEAAVAAAKG